MERDELTLLLVERDGVLVVLDVLAVVVVLEDVLEVVLVVLGAVRVVLAVLVDLVALPVERVALLVLRVVLPKVRPVATLRSGLAVAVLRERTPLLELRISRALVMPVLRCVNERSGWATAYSLRLTRGCIS